MKNALLMALGFVIVTDTGQGQQGGGRPPFGGFGGRDGEEMRRRIQDMMRRGGGLGGGMGEGMLDMARRSGLTLNEAPTMRMSLFETVQRIGLQHPGAKERAEQVLAKQLGSTFRGAEVVYIDKLLKEMAEEKYVDNVIDAAKYILLKEPSEDNNELRADRGSTEQLWRLLRQYKDESFVKDAEKMLLTERQVETRNQEGETELKTEFVMNRGAMEYLRSTLKGNVVDPFAKAYMTPNLSDRIKNDLYGTINDHIDTNAVAGQIMVVHFKGLMKQLSEQEAAAAAQQNNNGGAEGQRRGGDRRGGGDWRSRMRGGSVRENVKREISRLGSSRNVSPQVLIARQGILDNLRATTSDKNFQSMFDQVASRLQDLANPKPPTEGEEGREGRQRSWRLEDPRDAERREELRKRMEQFRNNRNREGGGEKKARPDA